MGMDTYMTQGWEERFQDLFQSSSIRLELNLGPIRLKGMEQLTSTKGRQVSKLIVALTTTLFTLIFVSPSQANWAVINEDANSVREFLVSSDEVVSIPQIGKMYAVVEDGMIIKFVTWTSKMHQELLVSLPYSLMVNYIDITGILRAEPINHGDKIYVQVTESAKVELDDKFVSAPVIDLPVFEGEAIVETGAEILAVNVNPDYSTSMTIKPIENNDPNKIVAIQVIADGMSWTSITTDNSSTPITVNHLPANELVTVQIAVRDLQTNQETIIQNVLTPTGSVEIPVIPNSRNVEQDRAEISAPKVETGSNGSSVKISFDQIANFDQERTRAAIVVVGPGGSTTYIGIDGNGGSVNVGDLSPTVNYVIKLVIRDVDSGEETIIMADK